MEREEREREGEAVGGVGGYFCGTVFWICYSFFFLSDVVFVLCGERLGFWALGVLFFFWICCCSFSFCSGFFFNFYFILFIILFIIFFSFFLFLFFFKFLSFF